MHLWKPAIFDFDIVLRHVRHLILLLTFVIPKGDEININKNRKKEKLLKFVGIFHCSELLEFAASALRAMVVFSVYMYFNFLQHVCPSKKFYI